MNKVITPNISKEKKLQVIKKQNNKCAKKPYSRVKGLEGHKCPLWNKMNKNGKFNNDDYIIIKINANEKSTLDNLIALCNKCYEVLTKIESSDYTSSDESITSKHVSDCESITRKNVSDCESITSKHI